MPFSMFQYSTSIMFFAIWAFIGVMVFYEGKAASHKFYGTKKHVELEENLKIHPAELAQVKPTPAKLTLLQKIKLKRKRFSV